MRRAGPRTGETTFWPNASSEDRGLKSGSIRVRVATLGSFGKWMIHRDKLVGNPVDRLTRPRRKARRPALPARGTVKVLLQQCGLGGRAIIALIACGGLRDS
jgi:site-specific recombinase XerC